MNEAFELLSDDEALSVANSADDIVEFVDVTATCLDGF